MFLNDEQEQLANDIAERLIARGETVAVAAGPLDTVAELLDHTGDLISSNDDGYHPDALLFAHHHVAIAVAGARRRSRREPTPGSTAAFNA